MADLSDHLYVDDPTGTISVFGIDALLALDNAVSCAEDMYKAMVNSADTTKYAPRVTITPVTKKAFRVEVSGQIELTERTKNNEYTEYLSDIKLETK